MPAHLLVGGIPYLQSVLYETAFSSSAPRTSTVLGEPSRKIPCAGVSLPDDGIYQAPFHSAELVDSLLEKVTVPNWTSVISDNKLLRRLLSVYFMHLTATSTTLHKDLLLEDKASGRTQFASPHLVNTVLASACQACREFPDRSKLWLPHSLAYMLLTEAKRLWELEPAGKICFTTIQAALCLSQIHILDGADHIGSMYLQKACEMGKARGIFGTFQHNLDSRLHKAYVFIT
ncbi:hypothetical protein K458DRAFT_429914 [Lentithecium fluviatile CBS 122367]|uniref:Transcription factor domain-containing protein n=1 Tax=Lentithecium fluviatile CBS 122367 TaxID=1168545 RepID=A0A6G1J637_9PLEO|nr:hypothetical protein K458DRAFT_429914 [Lentithecium fluviatile CBS 122367]